MDYNSSYTGAEIEALLKKLESLKNYDDSELVARIDAIQETINTLFSKDASSAIESFNEIIAFLEGIEDSQNLDSIIASIEQQIASKADASAIPTKVSQLTNDSNYQTETEVFGTVLFNVESTAANYGAVTLSDSTANYEFIDIYAATNDKHVFFSRVYQPNGKKIILAAGFMGNTSLFFKSKVYDCNGNKLTTASGTNGVLFAGEWGSEKNTLARGENTVGIWRVVGYKR